MNRKREKYIKREGPKSNARPEVREVPRAFITKTKFFTQG